jgi:hypothetical protein
MPIVSEATIPNSFWICDPDDHPVDVAASLNEARRAVDALMQMKRQPYTYRPATLQILIPDSGPVRRAAPSVEVVVERLRRWLRRY